MTIWNLGALGEGLRGGEGHYWTGPSRRGVARTARSMAGRQIEIAKIDSLFSFLENFPRPLAHSGPQATTICS